MGRIVTPKYRIEFLKVTPANVAETPAAWDVKGYGQVRGYGRPTDYNLKKYVDAMNESFKPGGVNEHLSKAFPGYQILEARIVRQSDGQEMARYIVNGHYHLAVGPDGDRKFYGLEKDCTICH